MTNNYLLRRIRYLYNYTDDKMISIFKLADFDVEKTTLLNWLKKEDDPLVIEMNDKTLATFLNGFIIEKRGKREGPMPVPEETLNNNIILRKLKIALDLTTDDILEIFASIDKGISKNELSAFFRRPDHRSYKPCLDQYLRNFLNALQSQNASRRNSS